MPNARFSETSVSCWFCVRESDWALCGGEPSLVEHYGYVRVSGLLIPACESCVRRLAGLSGEGFDFAAWRQEAFSQHTLSCQYRVSRQVSPGTPPGRRNKAYP